MFADELTRRGLTPAFDSKYRVLSEFHRQLHGGELNRRDFGDAENYVRNALKHFQRTADPEITCDLLEVAVWQLVRACDNASQLGIAIDRFGEFDDWFYENVVGV